MRNTNWYCALRNERRDEAIQYRLISSSGLLRCACHREAPAPTRWLAKTRTSYLLRERRHGFIDSQPSSSRDVSRFLIARVLVDRHRRSCCFPGMDSRNKCRRGRRTSPGTAPNWNSRSLACQRSRHGGNSQSGSPPRASPSRRTPSRTMPWQARLSFSKAVSSSSSLCFSLLISELIFSPQPKWDTGDRRAIDIKEERRKPSGASQKIDLHRVA